MFAPIPLISFPSKTQLGVHGGSNVATTVPFIANNLMATTPTRMGACCSHNNNSNNNTLVERHSAVASEALAEQPNR